jgi:hypothetical protein
MHRLSQSGQHDFSGGDSLSDNDPCIFLVARHMVNGPGLDVLEL